MGRTVSSALQNLLNLDSCISQSTIELRFQNGSGTIYYIATDDFTTGGHSYESDLRRLSELKQSILSNVDRVTASVQNVDQGIGVDITLEYTLKAIVIVGRYYADISNVLPATHVEFFRGQLVTTGLDEIAAEFEILNDLAAAGYCVAHWSLAENCQFQYRHAGTCGKTSGGLGTCNKKRLSAGGCFGNSNEFRFGGMEESEPVVSSAPGGDDLGDSGGDHHTCPRTDQFVLARAHWTTLPRPKRVSMLGTEDELYDPITGRFNKIKRIKLIQNVPIWQLMSRGWARGFSSGSHPIIQSSDDPTGRRVDQLVQDESVLTFSNGDRIADLVAYAELTDERAAVAKIELGKGHIYTYSNKSDGPFIVCHNSKPPPDDTYLPQ